MGWGIFFHPITPSSLLPGSTPLPGERGGASVALMLQDVALREVATLRGEPQFLRQLAHRYTLIVVPLDQAPLLRLELVQRRPDRHAGLAIHELLLHVLLGGDLVDEARFAPLGLLAEDQAVQRQRGRGLLRLPLARDA